MYGLFSRYLTEGRIDWASTAAEVSDPRSGGTRLCDLGDMDIPLLVALLLILMIAICIAFVFHVIVQELKSSQRRNDKKTCFVLAVQAPVMTILHVEEARAENTRADSKMVLPA